MEQRDIGHEQKERPSEVAVGPAAIALTVQATPIQSKLDTQIQPSHRGSTNKELTSAKPGSTHASARLRPLATQSLDLPLQASGMSQRGLIFPGRDPFLWCHNHRTG